MKKKLISLLLSATMVVSLAACGGTTNEQPQSGTKTETKTETAATPTPVPVEEMKFSQAPTIKSTVAVEDRLPSKSDVFVERYDSNGDALEIGVYCDSLRWANGGGGWDISRPMLETIVHYNSDGSYYANVIKSFESNADSTVWTFKLREGMKWSDGEPFTSEDIVFWYEQCHKTDWDNKKSWKALLDNETGNFAKLEAPDKYTVVWTFDTPKIKEDFIENGDFKFCWAPKHIFGDWVPETYGGTVKDEDVLKHFREMGIDYSSVKDLGKNTLYYFWNAPGIPTLNPWVLTTQEGLNNRKNTCQLIRNEYYWKVDAAGQQLPYFDTLDMIKYGDDQQKLEFLSGEIDFLEVGLKDIKTITEEATNSKTNPFTPGVGMDQTTNWGSETFTFNYTCTDTKYAELFNNIKFREAFSICVDRDYIAKQLGEGKLNGGQAAPGKGQVWYDEAWATKWTTYDVDRANKLLQECGLKKGSDGYYTFADGSDLTIAFFGYDTSADASVHFAQFQKYFEALGLKTTFAAYDVGVYDGKIDANEWMAVYGPHTSAGGDLSDREAPIVPVSGAGGAEWYGNYGFYYETNGEQGTKPTGDMAKLVDLWNQYKAAKTAAEKKEIEGQIYKVHADNLWTIGYLESTPVFSLINEKIHNYPRTSISIDKYMYSNIKHPWTMFVK